MKVKYLGALTVLLTIFGCDDNTGSIGLDMLPGSDKLSVETATFNVITKSMQVDEVYAKTTTGYVGKFTDPLFGSYDASFLTQLNCTENLTFPKMYSAENPEYDMAGDTLAYVNLFLTYSFFGDSLNASRMSIYELNLDTPLEKNYYTTINPEEFYSKENLLARKAYTAVDMSKSDSLRNAQGDFLLFSFDREVGRRIVKANWDNPTYFKDSESFIKNVFAGLYVKNDYGDGTILYVDQVYMDIAYPLFAKDSLDNTVILKDENGNDSIYYGGRTFAATKEIIQANKFTNSEEIADRVNETEWTYIKSPAGIFTQAKLDIDGIYEQLDADTLNSVKLTFNGYQPKKNEDVDDVFQMSAPSQILLVREKDMKAFFEENRLTDNVTSFLASYSTKGEYTFSNITFLINTCINEKKELLNNEGKNWTKEEWDEWEEENKWDSVVLIPVTLRLESSSSTSIVSIEHDLRPAYVQLKGGDDILQMEVHYTVFQ